MKNDLILLKKNVDEQLDGLYLARDRFQDESIKGLLGDLINIFRNYGLTLTRCIKEDKDVALHYYIGFLNCLCQKIKKIEEDIDNLSLHMATIDCHQLKCFVESEIRDYS